MHRTVIFILLLLFFTGSYGSGARICSESPAGKPGQTSLTGNSTPITQTTPAIPPNNPATTRTLHFNLNVHGGTVLPHHETLVYFNREYLRSLELNAWFRPRENRARSNTIPGAGYLFSGMGNKSIYGNAHALFFSLLGPPAGEKLPVSFKLGVGLAYLTKKFDPETNYFNRAIGTHLNVYGQISLKGRFPVAGDRLLLKPGISFHHMSNGALISPNQGLNLFTLSAGIEFRSDLHYTQPARAVSEPPDKGRHRFTFIYAPGIKQVDRRVDRHIFTSSLIFDYGYEVLPERSLGMGISMFYNDSWAWVPYIRVEKDQELSPFQSALHLSLQMNRGPLAFILHPGIYIHMPAKDRPYMTNRLGIKYSLSNNITLQFAIKAHWLAVADYIEWGFGYEFNR